MSYDSIEDAAAAAQKIINDLPHSNKQEYIGLIYQDPETGKYLFTDPQNKNLGSRSNEKSSGTFNIPKGSLRALIHNHPGDDHKASFFSPDDMGMSKQLGVPSFISVGNDLLSWNPKDGEVKGRGDRQRGIGTAVLAQIAMDLLPKRRGE